MCNYINAHEDLITITTFGEYRAVMKKVMMVIKEAHNTERKRRQTSKKERSDYVTSMKQKAKSLIQRIQRGGLRKEEIGRRIEEIFGNGSLQEIEGATTSAKMVEVIEEMTRLQEQFEIWEG